MSCAHSFCTNNEFSVQYAVRLLTAIKLKVTIQVWWFYTTAGKSAIVTGGGSGIGRAICVLYARKGASVGILDVNTEAAETVVGEIAAEAAEMGTGGKAMAVSCDVTKTASVEEAFKAVSDAYGGVDIVVNNAGIGHVGTIETTEEADMDRLYAVNVKGVFNCTKAAVKAMLTPIDESEGAPPRGGSIVNLASIASHIGLADRAAYSMSKGAVWTLTLSTATDYVRKNIRCNALAPGRVHTPFVDAYLAKNYPDTRDAKFKELSEYQPCGRMGRPDEIAAMALYLAADESSFVTGALMPIDGGVAAVM